MRGEEANEQIEKVYPEAISDDVEASEVEDASGVDGGAAECGEPSVAVVGGGLVEEVLRRERGTRMKWDIAEPESGKAGKNGTKRCCWMHTVGLTLLASNSGSQFRVYLRHRLATGFANSATGTISAISSSNVLKTTWKRTTREPFVQKTQKRRAERMGAAFRIWRDTWNRLLYSWYELEGCFGATSSPKPLRMTRSEEGKRIEEAPAKCGDQRKGGCRRKQGSRAIPGKRG